MDARRVAAERHARPQMTAELKAAVRRADAEEVVIIEDCADRDGDAENRASCNAAPTRRRYRRGKFLGKGGFARVYEVTDVDSGELFACKIVDKRKMANQRARQKLLTEIQIHRSLRHRHIVRFIRFFEDENNVYLLLELCGSQSMADLVRRRKFLTEREARQYMLQIIDAVSYMHTERLVIHRDLKLSNLFLAGDGSIRVGDFGLATQLLHGKERKRTICGTPNYIAPEVLAGGSSDCDGHSFEVDVWSVGVVLYTMLVGRPPFETTDVRSTYQRIQDNEYDIPTTLSAEAENLIRRILASQPRDRPAISELKHHVFFRSEKASVGADGESATLSERAKKAADPGGLDSAEREALAAAELDSKERDALSIAHDELASSFALLRVTKPARCANMKQLPPVSTGVWVSKWVDYSSKYGVGYKLCDGSVGVYFNDATRMIRNAGGDTVEYYVPRHSAAYNIGERSTRISMRGKQPSPRQLGKKLRLRQHFEDYLADNTPAGQEDAVLNWHDLGEKQAGTQMAVHVKHWLQTRHAIVFRLSNRTIQVHFRDSTEVIVAPDARVVSYRDRHGRRSAYTLDAIPMSQPELCKRLRYTKTLLAQMLSKTSGSAPSSSREYIAAKAASS